MSMLTLPLLSNHWGGADGADGTFAAGWNIILPGLEIAPLTGVIEKEGTDIRVVSKAFTLDSFELLFCSIPSDVVTEVYHAVSWI